MKPSDVLFASIVGVAACTDDAKLSDSSDTGTCIDGEKTDCFKPLDIKLTVNLEIETILSHCKGARYSLNVGLCDWMNGYGPTRGYDCYGANDGSMNPYPLTELNGVIPNSDTVITTIEDHDKMVCADYFEFALNVDGADTSCLDFNDTVKIEPDQLGLNCASQGSGVFEFNCEATPYGFYGYGQEGLTCEVIRSDWTEEAEDTGA